MVASWLLGSFSTTCVPFLNIDLENKRKLWNANRTAKLTERQAQTILDLHCVHPIGSRWQAHRKLSQSLHPDHGGSAEESWETMDNGLQIAIEGAFLTIQIYYTLLLIGGLLVYVVHSLTTEDDDDA